MIRSWDFFSRACACQWHTPTECFQVSSNEFHYLKAQFDTNHAHGEKVSPFALNSSTLTQNIAYFTNHYEGVFTIPNELPSWFPLIGLKCTQLTFVAHFSGFALVFFFVSRCSNVTRIKSSHKSKCSLIEPNHNEQPETVVYIQIWIRHDNALAWFSSIDE